MLNNSISQPPHPTEDHFMLNNPLPQTHGRIRIFRTKCCRKIYSQPHLEVNRESWMVLYQENLESKQQHLDQRQTQLRYHQYGIDSNVDQKKIGQWYLECGPLYRYKNISKFQRSRRFLNQIQIYCQSFRIIIHRCILVIIPYFSLNNRRI